MAGTDAAEGSARVNGPLWGRAAADWAAIQEQQFQDAYTAVFDRLAPKPGATVCDVGCGAGMALQIAARRGCRVVGMDASEALLAIARQRNPDGDFQLGDMETLPFGDDSADVVTGFNAFQYAAHPTAALGEARRVARRGGHLAIMTWGEPEGMPAATLVAALKPLLPAPPPGTPGPFALSQKAALEALAAAAGWQPLEVHDVATVWRYANLDEALRGLRSSGVAARAVDHSGVAAVDDAHRAALAPFRQPDGRYEIAAGFRWLLALNPG